MAYMFSWDLIPFRTLIREKFFCGDLLPFPHQSVLNNGSWGTRENRLLVFFKTNIWHYSYFLKQISGITRIFETKFEIFWEEVLLFGDAIVIERYH